MNEIAGGLNLPIGILEDRLCEADVISHCAFEEFQTGRGENDIRIENEHGVSFHFKGMTNAEIVASGISEISGSIQDVDGWKMCADPL